MTEKYKLEISEPHIEDVETGECYDLHGKDNLMYIVKLWNELVDKNIQSEEDLDYYKTKCVSLETGMFNLERENKQLKSTIKEVIELLSDEVDLFSDKATEHDIIAYVELKELDNKDAFYMATATKEAIKMLKELQK